MKDNNYSMVEGILYNYPKLKVEIDNLRLDLEEVKEIVALVVPAIMRKQEAQLRHLVV